MPPWLWLFARSCRDPFLNPLRRSPPEARCRDFRGGYRCLRLRAGLCACILPQNSSYFRRGGLAGTCQQTTPHVCRTGTAESDDRDCPPANPWPKPMPAELTDEDAACDLAALPPPTRPTASSIACQPTPANLRPARFAPRASRRRPHADMPGLAPCCPHRMSPWGRSASGHPAMWRMPGAIGCRPVRSGRLEIITVHRNKWANLFPCGLAPAYQQDCPVSNRNRKPPGSRRPEIFPHAVRLSSPPRPPKPGPRQTFCHSPGRGMSAG